MLKTITTRTLRPFRRIQAAATYVTAGDSGSAPGRINDVPARIAGQIAARLGCPAPQAFDTRLTKEDAELWQKMEELVAMEDGGVSGVEYDDGLPHEMKLLHSSENKKLHP